MMFHPKSLNTPVACIVGIWLLAFATSAVHSEQLKGKDLLKKQTFSRESMTMGNSGENANDSWGGTSNGRLGSVSGLSILHPDRLSMQQSYSTAMTSSSIGTHSYGMYLNTLSYQLYRPLSLSMDMGFYTPLYSSGMYAPLGSASSSNPGSFVIPRVGLDYKPTESLSFSLQVYNLKNPSPIGHWPNSSLYR